MRALVVAGSIAVAACAARPPSSTPTRRMPYSLGLGGGYAVGDALSHRMSGPEAAGYGLVRFPYVSLGARASFAALDGTYRISTRTVHTSATPASLALYAQGTALDRLWGGVSAGVDFVQIEDDTTPTVFKTGFITGVDAGVDLVRFGRHRICLFGRAETELGSSTDYRALSLGLGWRMF